MEIKSPTKLVANFTTNDYVRRSAKKIHLLVTFQLYWLGTLDNYHQYVDQVYITTHQPRR